MSTYTCFFGDFGFALLLFLFYRGFCFGILFIYFVGVSCLFLVFVFFNCFVVFFVFVGVG